HPPSTLLSFILTLPRPPRPTLFPYTTLFRSPPTEIPNRCAKVSAPLQLLHIEARITSAAVSKRFRCRKNLQHICGLAKFPQESKDRKSTRLNSSHVKISYAVFCLKKKKKHT